MWNNFFENVWSLNKSKFINEEIKSRLKSGNTCYHLVQDHFFSNLLSKNIKIYRTVILPVYLYGCETWSVILREEYRFRVCVNRVLWKIFGPMRDEVAGEWRKVHHKEFFDLYYSQGLIWAIKSRRMQCSMYLERRCANRVFVGNLVERDHLQDLSIDGRIILK
jgi:hypothetical protein